MRSYCVSQVHLDAGIHEATEMAHLRMELAAANEELDFLRKREEEVQAEGARLQMVAEMNKRLGANVSRCVPSCGPSWEFGLVFL